MQHSPSRQAARAQSVGLSREIPSATGLTVHSFTLYRTATHTPLDIIPEGGDSGGPRLVLVWTRILGECRRSSSSPPTPSALFTPSLTATPSRVKRAGATNAPRPARAFHRFSYQISHTVRSTYSVDCTQSIYALRLHAPTPSFYIVCTFFDERCSVVHTTLRWCPCSALCAAARRSKDY